MSFLHNVYDKFAACQPDVPAAITDQISDLGEDHGDIGVEPPRQLTYKQVRDISFVLAGAITQHLNEQQTTCATVSSMGAFVP